MKKVPFVHQTGQVILVLTCQMCTTGMATMSSSSFCLHCLTLILDGGCMGSPSPVKTSFLSSLSSLPYPLSSPPSILPSQVFAHECEVGGGQLAMQGGGGGGGKSR